MKLFLIAALLAVAAAAPSSYTSKDAYTTEKPMITIVSQSDVRNLDGSSQWSNAGSDGTTREESQVQKKIGSRVVYTKDSYGKDVATDKYEDVYGNTNKGASYWISPEGERFTLTWAADEAGFAPKGDHLPVAPVHVYELPVAPVHEYVLPVAPVHEYVLPVAPESPFKFTGAGYKIF